MTSFLWVWYMFCFLWSLYWLLLPFFWKLQWSMPLVVGTLAEKRVLSSFMGVQEKQMKQCNICQILSSELLLSDIYSCTCLMLILFCLDWPFLRERGKKPWSPLKSDIFVQQPELSLLIFMCMIHFYCNRTGSLILIVCVFHKLPSGASHQPPLTVSEDIWMFFASQL